jgi:hypothetical protein
MFTMKSFTHWTAMGVFSLGLILARPADAAVMGQWELTGGAVNIDLSTLFFGVSRGDFYNTWNIGELATGQYNPETREFTVSWNHMFDGGKHEGPATFFLKGIAEIGTHPVAIPASLVLYATGLFGLGSLTWWRRQFSLPTAA